MPRSKTAVMLRSISYELKSHIPFTMMGAITGMALVWVIIFFSIPRSVSETLFWVFHPLHVYISALTTTAMLRLYRKSSFVTTILIGYIGSIGIATVSDSIIPYFAEWILQLPHSDLHIGCIDKWWLVSPLSILGIITAYILPTTKFPHAAHVFLSTSASLFHIAMALGATLAFGGYLLIFVFLFLAVWVPCCTSDIIFPLFFSGKSRDIIHP